MVNNFQLQLNAVCNVLFSMCPRDNKMHEPIL